jgi:hypothetical protein
MGVQAVLRAEQKKLLSRPHWVVRQQLSGD